MGQTHSLQPLISNVNVLLLAAISLDVISKLILCRCMEGLFRVSVQRRINNDYELNFGSVHRASRLIWWGEGPICAAYWILDTGPGTEAWQYQTKVYQTLSDFNQQTWQMNVNVHVYLGEVNISRIWSQWYRMLKTQQWFCKISPLVLTLKWASQAL